LLVVPDVLKALQDMARSYRKKFDLSVIGITGTNGKTTCKEMMSAVLSKLYTTLATPGNLNNEIGVPLTLLKISGDTQVAIVEMGADKPGDIAFLCDLAKPGSGVITNVGAAHLQNFKTMEAIAATKSELFDALREDGVRFVNLDDARLREHALHTKGLVTFGTHPQAGYRAVILSTDDLGCTTIRIETPEHHTVEVKLPVPGTHHVSNALIAATIGFSLGVEDGDVKDALENYVPLSNRMGIKRHQNLIILDDTYNANPESMRAALETLASIRTGGRRIAVLGDMLELGDLSTKAHEDVGRQAAEKKIDAVFLFGPEMASARDAAAGMVTLRHFHSKSELNSELKSFVQPGDVVLFKGSRGMKMEETMLEIINT
jgi:UDP-N-acetylmuramoyl-tripeptide--D-alanyl-D-alanine ligase